MPSVVTIDGPAGAGKSTVARLLAGRLGWRLLDTGAMYRAVALAALRSGLDLAREGELAELAGGLSVELPPGRVLLDSEDVTTAIRTPEVSQAASRVAVSPGVRSCLVGWQRRFASEFDTVTEGRDQGTVVFPGAFRKFYLTASPEARAARRHAELAARGEPADLATVLRDQIERDARDARRATGPMCPAPDALIVDTSGLEAPAVLGLVERAVRDAGLVPWLPSDDGPTPPVPPYFSCLTVAWDPSKSRLIAVGRSAEDAERAARDAANLDGAIVEKIP
jgi:cytidylate kinase